MTTHGTMLRHQVKLNLPFCMLQLLCSIAYCSPAAMAASPCTCSSDHTQRDDTINYSIRSINSSYLKKDVVVLTDKFYFTSGDIFWDEVNKSEPAFLVLSNKVALQRADNNAGGVSREASFNTTFNFDVPQTRKLAFVVLPNFLPTLHRKGGLVGDGNFSSTANATASLSSRHVAVEVGPLRSYDRPDIGLNITIAPATNSTAAKCTVWIQYIAPAHRVLVYVAIAGDGNPPTATLDADFNLTRQTSPDASIGFFATVEDVFRVYDWDLSVEKLPSATGRNKSLWLVILASVLGSAAVMVSVAACYFASRFRALQRELKLSEALKRLPGMPREFKYAVIKKATKNFDDAMKLGKGGFGAVYKGVLPAGKNNGRGHVEVAVKKFMRNEDRCYDDFLAEVDIINRLRHRNIVPLVGWCYEKGELLLIYEYMPNGSLDQHLFQTNIRQKQPILQWGTRYNIIRDIAAGLHYVHHEYERVVLHRDIKASNIMLDSSFQARLGDFGIARVVACDKNSFTDMGVAGTWGFIAPEYPVSHKATRKTDVYAFGVLVLEIVTGKRSLLGDVTFPLLNDWVWHLHNEGRLLEAVDSEIAIGESDADDANRLLLLGLACNNPNPSDRPSMAEVVQVIAKSLPPPNVPLLKPIFMWPPEGGIPLDFDDITMTSDFDESCSEEASGSDGLITNFQPEITKRRARIAQPRIYGEHYV